MQSNGNILTESIASSEVIDLVVAGADVGLDALITSGAFDGVPLFGLITGGYKAQKTVRDILYFKKIVNFLQNLRNISETDRLKFTQNLNKSGEAQRFGETILLILDKSEDTVKPQIIGKIISAHILGKFSYEAAMRLVAIINRCYTPDFEYLKNFQQGTQREGTPIAESLHAAGLLGNGGFDGGTFEDDQSGGVIYYLNGYGKLLIEHGLS